MTAPRLTTITVTALLSLAAATPTPARAGSTTQTVTDFYTGGNNQPPLGAYNQLDPSLGPLNAVAITTRVAWSSGLFYAFNPTDAPITCNVLFVGGVTTDAGFIPYSLSMQTTMLAHSQNNEAAIPDTIYFQSAFLTANLSSFMGLGTTTPDPTVSTMFTADNPAITFAVVTAPACNLTETLIYYYGDTFGPPAAEPTSIVMMGMGLTGVGVGAVMRRRKWRTK